MSVPVRNEIELLDLSIKHISLVGVKRTALGEGSADGTPVGKCCSIGVVAAFAGLREQEAGNLEIARLAYPSQFNGRKRNAKAAQAVIAELAKTIGTVADDGAEAENTVFTFNDDERTRVTDILDVFRRTRRRLKDRQKRKAS